MTIALIAALPAELKLLVRGWERRGDLYHGRIGTLDAVGTSAGMGAAAATRACEAVLAAGNLDAIASIGYAGSLSCGLQVGEAYAAREVIDAATGEVFPTAEARGQRLITLGSVAGSEEKRQLALKYQAVMVDMEAAAVARFARAHNLAFHCFKAITDGPSDKLPDFNRFMGPDGHLRMPALLAWAAIHPQFWGALRRLGQNSTLAARQLAFFVSRCVADS
jgi:adenosylhomocysteine nucleosidase